MNLLKFISIPVFIISFALGILLVYVLGPEQNIVYIYPTPENIDKVQWKDKAENCYTWNQQEVTCPDNVEDIQSIPIQN